MSLFKKNNLNNLNEENLESAVEGYTKETTPAYTGIQITAMNWERIQLVLTVTFKLVPNQPKFYLENIDKRLRVDVSTVEKIDDNNFKLTIDLFFGNQNSYVPGGFWYLMTVDKKPTQQEAKIVFISPELYANPTEVLDRSNLLEPFIKHVRNGGGSFYRIRPLGDQKTNLFHINITTRFPEKIGFFGTIKKEIRKKYFKWNKELRTAIFRWSYRISYQLFKQRDNRILFTSDSRSSLSGNMAFIYNRLEERGLNQTFDIHTVLKSNLSEKRPFVDKFRLPFYLATSKYIFLDDFHPMLYLLDYPKDKEIIQVWHATGHFKTVGFSRLGKVGAPSMLSPNHRIYTKSIVGSDSDVPFYAEAFGIPQENVLVSGIPRLDPFFNSDYHRQIRKKMFKSFPGLRNKDEIILFAPTFRGAGSHSAHYPYDQIDFKGFEKYCREHNAAVIFKMHPFVTEPIYFPDGTSDIFFDAFSYREVNDLLFITDLLITDYSSVIFEYSIMEKPMLFYAFDLNEYISTRDFYEPYVDFVPGKIVETSKELLNAMENRDYEFDKVLSFKDKFFKYQDSNSTDRVIDSILTPNKLN